jgi:hypothetical protein
MNQDGIWLSILDYANVKKTSISTIRRSIKSGHVRFKEENGKYFIFTKNILVNCFSEKDELALRFEFELLKKQKKELQEEVDDLKMLLSIYENRQNEEFPPMPAAVI